MVEYERFQAAEEMPDAKVLRRENICIWIISCSP